MAVFFCAAYCSHRKIPLSLVRASCVAVTGKPRKQVGVPTALTENTTHQQRTQPQENRPTSDAYQDPPQNHEGARCKSHRVCGALSSLCAPRGRPAAAATAAPPLILTLLQQRVGNPKTRESKNSHHVRRMAIATKQNSFYILLWTTQNYNVSYYFLGLSGIIIKNPKLIIIILIIT